MFVRCLLFATSLGNIFIYLIFSAMCVSSFRGRVPWPFRRFSDVTVRLSMNDMSWI